MNTPNTAPTAHHPRSPSRFPAWSECPEFEGEADDPKDLETDRARGTLKHAALAKLFLGIADAYEGLTQEEIEDVRWTYDKVIEGANAVGYHMNDFKVESRVTLMDPAGFDPLYFGTVDVEYGPYIEDAKFGEVKNYFPQMAGYALAKMDRDGIDTVFARVRYGWRRRTVEHTITRETAERVVYGILRKRENPNRRPVACEYCGMCAKAATCSAINVIVDDSLLANRPDWNFRLPTASLSDAGADPVRIGAMKWLWKTYIEPWGEALDRQANYMAMLGNVPLGFKKQDNKGSLVIKDSAAAVELLEKQGVPRAKVLAAAEFTMTGLVKAYREVHKVSEDKAAAAIEAELVKAGAAYRGEGGFRLIRKKDAEADIRAGLARPVETLNG